MTEPNQPSPAVLLARRIACHILDVDPMNPSEDIDRLFAPGNARGEFAVADAERALGKLAQLKSIGTLLSNVAFNLAQNKDLDDFARETLDRLRREWDEAVKQ